MNESSMKLCAIDAHINAKFSEILELQSKKTLLEKEATDGTIDILTENTQEVLIRFLEEKGFDYTTLGDAVTIDFSKDE